MKTIKKGIAITHSKFGVGVVIEITREGTTVKFANGESKLFKYPNLVLKPFDITDQFKV